MQMTFTGERYVPELRGQIYYEHLHRYAIALALAKNKDVLDIASGEGYGAALLSMVAKSVTGVDVDDASVNYASARYTAMNLSFMKGSATQIPLADRSIDVIVSFETIEHLMEHERMLGEMKRVLRTDGHVIISSPNKLVYSDSRDYHNPFHVRELYFHEFRDLLRGFFPEVRIFGQRIFAGSAVHPLGGVSTDSRWLGPTVEPQTGISALPDPEYFIAVCSCQAGSQPPDLTSVFVDPRDDLLSDIRSGGLAGAAVHVEIANGAKELASSAVRAIGGNGSPPQANESDAGGTSDLATLQAEFAAEKETLRAEFSAERQMLQTQLEREREAAAKAVRDRGQAALLQENLNEEVRQLNVTCARAEQEIFSLREQVAEREAATVAALAMMSTLQSALRAEVARSAEIAQNFMAKQQQLDETGKALADTDRALTQTTTLLADTLGSNSWRLTAPVRRIGIKVRSLRAAQSGK